MTDGKLGAPIPELDIYELAIDVFYCNPAELRQWDVYDINRIKLVLQARAEARETRQRQAEAELNRK